MALRTVGVRLAAEVSGYVAGMRVASKSTKDFAQDLDQAARKGQLDAVADQAAGMGIGLVAAFGAAAMAAAKFDKQMSEVGAVSNATGADLERLREAALQAGKDTAYSATEAAKAEAELAKAGLGTADILGGALTGSLSLAAAGSLDLAESADIAAKTMNVFQLEGQDVGHIADVLAAAANKSATDVHEMGEALRQGGMAANGAGISLEETVGTLAAFADRALVGSDAGTSLKTALMMLQAPTDKAKSLMEQLGINAYDASGKFVGMASLAGQLQRQLGGLTQEQRNAALAQIFGADAMRAANVLYSVGEKGIREYTAAVDDQGAAAEVAAKKMDNLAGDIEKLKGSLETLAIEAGSGANGGLRAITQGANALVDQLGALPPAVTSTMTVVAGLSGALMLGAAGWVRMRRSNAEALGELRATGPAGVRAADGLQTASKWAGRAAIAFVALEVGATAVRAAIGTDLNPQVDALAKGLEEWSSSGAKGGEAARLLGKDFEHLSYDLGTLDSGFWAGLGNGVAGVVEGFTGLGSAMDESLEHAKERITALDGALAQMVQSGNADVAARVFAQLTAEAEKQGISVEELTAGLPQYAGLLETTGSASQKAAGDVGAVGDAASQTAEEIDKLNSAFGDLFDQEMSLDEATIAAKEGMASLKEELASGARTLDINTQAGRDNASALLGQIQKIKDLRDSRVEHGEALDSANAKYQRDIDGLRRSAIAAGFTKAEVNALIAKYRAVPEKVNTNVSANTAAANSAITGFAKRINTLDGRVITVYTRITKSGEYIPGQGTVPRRWGGITEHAQDGLLREAQVASPAAHRYGWAEPATGGEAFIPRFGDVERSRAIWAHVGQQWLGMRPAGGGGTTVVNLQLSAGVIGSRYELESWLAGAVDTLRRKGRI